MLSIIPKRNYLGACGYIVLETLAWGFGFNRSTKSHLEPPLSTKIATFLRGNIDKEGMIRNSQRRHTVQKGMHSILRVPTM